MAATVDYDHTTDPHHELDSLINRIYHGRDIEAAMLSTDAVVGRIYVFYPPDIRFRVVAFIFRHHPDAAVGCLGLTMGLKWGCDCPLSTDTILTSLSDMVQASGVMRLELISAWLACTRKHPDRTVGWIKDIVDGDLIDIEPTVGSVINAFCAAQLCVQHHRSGCRVRFEVGIWKETGRQCLRTSTEDTACSEIDRSRIVYLDRIGDD